MTKADADTPPRDDLAVTTAFVIALAATLGALFIGEVLGQMPCTLCWYQRIAMFPLVPILGLSIWRGDRLARVYALPFGIAAWRLGAGRARAEDPVIHAAGIDLHVKPGDSVASGAPLFTLSAQDAARFPRALDALENAWEIGEAEVSRTPLVLERITA